MYISCQSCADCSAYGAQWASTSLYVFLCSDCAAVHRELPGSKLNNVKSLCHDTFTSEEEEKLNSEANKVAAERFEAHVPLWYFRPSPLSCLALKSEWILAKYSREDFALPDKDMICARSPFSCQLYKKSRDSPTYQLRTFVISDCDGTLQYSHIGKKQPRDVFNLLEVNACFVPEKINNSNGLQLVVPSNRSIRNLFVYSDNSEDIVNLFQALRCAKFRLLQSAYPEVDAETLVSELTQPFPKEGWMKKGGMHFRDSFRKRWFTVHLRYLYYFDTPMSPSPKGRIFLGHRDMGYYVHKGFLTANSKLSGIGFTIVTPSKDHVLLVDTELDCLRWTEVLDRLINERIHPKDLAKYRSQGENL